MDAKLQELCRQAHEDRIRVGMLDTDTKNRTLELAADALMAHEQEILEANAIDMERGRERNMPQGLLDRLKLDHDRLLGMADGLRQVAKLEDPIGEVMSMRKRPNGLIIGKVRVAIGVVGIIFEARPNVTSDAFGLCFKSGNCAILKGGSDAIHSNIAIVSAMQEALRRMNIPKGALSLIESTDRETTNAFMKMKDYVDLLIPRGGRGLIQSVQAALRPLFAAAEAFAGKLLLGPVRLAARCIAPWKAARAAAKVRRNEKRLAKKQKKSLPTPRRMLYNSNVSK